jgi:hypothetical protein
MLAGVEPPLGFSVEDQPPTGELFEQERSSKASSVKAAPEADDVGPVQAVEVNREHRPFKRRI